MAKAVFFDKDGVLNIDRGIVKKILSEDIYPEAGEVISRLRELGYKIFVVTNQTVVSRGVLTEKELISNFSDFEKMLKDQNEKAVIDKIYYCPHHPNATVEDYKTNCECRKPRPGMLVKASREYSLDLTKCFMIGDRPSDIIAGKKAGCKTVQILSGKHKDKIIESNMDFSQDELKPDFTIDKISELGGVIR